MIFISFVFHVGDEKCLETCEDHRWNIKNISDSCRAIEFADRLMKESSLSVERKFNFFYN